METVRQLRSRPTTIRMIIISPPVGRSLEDQYITDRFVNQRCASPCARRRAPHVLVFPSYLMRSMPAPCASGNPTAEEAGCFDPSGCQPCTHHVPGCKPANEAKDGRFTMSCKRCRNRSFLQHKSQNIGGLNARKTSDFNMASSPVDHDYLRAISF